MSGSIPASPPGAAQESGRVLVITQAPSLGGVNAMTGFVTSTLRSRGIEPVLAYYKPYTQDRSLSVPSWELPLRRPRLRRVETADGLSAIEVGVRIPELENRRYRSSALWRGVINKFDRVLVVSGSPLAGAAIAEMSVPSLMWLATPFDADRHERVKAMAWHRQALDRLIDAPQCSRLEKRILRRAPQIAAISKYSAGEFAKLAPGRNFPVVPVPVDMALFRPGSEQPIPGRIGFVGRFADPRKNLPLLLKAVALCRRGNPALSLSIIGDGPVELAHAMLAGHGLLDCARVQAGVPRGILPALYREMDLLVMPSYQEGLGIVALEAMACGTPVVATRCGGPEEFIVPGANGYLTPIDEEAVAEAALKVIGDRPLRSRMAQAATGTVSAGYSVAVARAAFLRLFEQLDRPTRGPIPS